MEYKILLHESKLYGLIAPRQLLGQMTTTLIAHLALVRTVLVLDAGNRYDDYGVIRQVAAAGTSNKPDNSAPEPGPAVPDGCSIEAALQRILIARSFTCYQITARLAQQAAAPVPIIVLDLPSTFEDENVPYPERMRLLGACLQDLRRLAATAPVLITAVLRTTRPTALAATLVKRIRETADFTWHFEEPSPVIMQLSLFCDDLPSSPLFHHSPEPGQEKDDGEFLVHTRFSPSLRRYLPNKN